MTRVAIFMLTVILAAAGPARAGQQMGAGGLEASDGWARATPGGARAGAAFFTLTNRGTATRRVVGVLSDVAKRPALHTHIMDGNIMRMRRLDGIDLPPGKSVTLKPGGRHVMLMGLRAPLKQGETFSITLVMANGEKLTVPVVVKKIGAMGPGMARHGGAMRHK